jgi:RES domain-containing protein
MRTVGVGGRYSRVADPTWADPLDIAFAAKTGGRWNPPGLAALYLNKTREAALANARRAVFERWGRTLEDVRPELLPDLQYVNVAGGGAYLDAVTPEGIAELGLAPTYPTDIPHPPCQGIGLAADRAGLDGVSPLSAVAPTQEELVVFARGMIRVERSSRLRFPWTEA